MDNANKAWISTFTGKRFCILDPKPEQICIEDIAHALANQCRFTGHTKYHYSVAQHSVYASQLVPPEFAFEALMHDASEAYICDMSRPLKHYTEAGTAYLRVEATIQTAIARKYGLPEVMSPEVKKADNEMLYAEKEQIMPPMDWDTRWGDETPANIKIVSWTPAMAKFQFLKRFKQLASY
jgi:uncharacterized protein